ncbi:hypothetical protein H2198_010371 [Neophaeococcomyces mojaviensis]|uniref:Uncharacterized protein n=1 Tax=Neophaeococcomyces mojaviensis TaxID=3383035 RepID=A0ACC2ZRP8_9EURO|nr:hypothetical protein H2198_010371 [Knufia sp. JES_112]
MKQHKSHSFPTCQSVLTPSLVVHQPLRFVPVRVQPACIKELSAIYLNVQSTKVKSTRAQMADPASPRYGPQDCPGGYPQHSSSQRHDTPRNDNGSSYPPLNAARQGQYPPAPAAYPPLQQWAGQPPPAQPYPPPPPPHRPYVRPIFLIAWSNLADTTSRTRITNITTLNPDQPNRAKRCKRIPIVCLLRIRLMDAIRRQLIQLDQLRPQDSAMQLPASIAERERFDAPAMIAPLMVAAKIVFDSTRNASSTLSPPRLLSCQPQPFTGRMQSVRRQQEQMVHKVITGNVRRR